jgi:hypothetical protein
MTSESRIDRSGFAQAIGYEEGRVDDRTVGLLDKADLRYQTIDRAGQDALQAETANEIEKGFKVVGQHREDIWRLAWDEQLKRFEGANYDLQALTPKFVDGSVILRWQGQYIRSITNQFELAFVEVLRDWVFRTFLADVDHLYEFGSGSAFNVAAYAQLFPQVHITALDWAPEAVRIADLLGTKRGMKISGRRFDFFAPDRTLKLGPQSGVLTFCALEQTGDRFGQTLDYLLESRPRRVVHIEPTAELYDATSPHDELAIRYHGQRKYLSGLLPAIQHLAREKKVRIPWTRRLRFGSRFHECYTVMVWEPM